MFLNESRVVIVDGDDESSSGNDENEDEDDDNEDDEAKETVVGEDETATFDEGPGEIATFKRIEEIYQTNPDR